MLRRDLLDPKDVLERIGPVTDKLFLPMDLSRIRNVVSCYDVEKVHAESVACIECLTNVVLSGSRRILKEQVLKDKLRTIVKVL